MDTIFSFGDYAALLPPFPLDYDDWTREQAEAYKDWFIAHMHERAEYVLKKCAASPAGAVGRARLPDALLQVWEWFLRVAEIEPVPQQEIEAQRAQFGIFGDIGDSFITKRRLSLKTEYIIRDIGMLFSVVLTENYPSLYWDIHTRPKRSIYYHHPVIRGFVDADPSYPRPFQPDFEPVHMVRVQAARLLHGTAADTDLRRIYDLYVQWCGGPVPRPAALRAPSKQDRPRRVPEALQDLVEPYFRVSLTFPDSRSRTKFLRKGRSGDLYVRHGSDPDQRVPIRFRTIIISGPDDCQAEAYLPGGEDAAEILSGGVFSIYLGSKELGQGEAAF